MTLCEDCVYYVCDEAYDGRFCEQDLDEDEMERFLHRSLTSCPFYHPGNGDYYLAGKQ